MVVRRSTLKRRSAYYDPPSRNGIRRGPFSFRHARTEKHYLIIAFDCPLQGPVDVDCEHGR